jgi:hypothetical protein
MFGDNTSLDYVSLAGFFDLDDLAPFVVAALGAGAMRHLLLVAVRALGKRMSFEKVVSATS